MKNWKSERLVIAAVGVSVDDARWQFADEAYRRSSMVSHHNMIRVVQTSASVVSIPTSYQPVLVACESVY